MDESTVRTFRTGLATLMALMLLPVAWYAVTLLFHKLGVLIGGAKPEPVEVLTKAGWFVGAFAGGFVGPWASATLVRGVPMRDLYIWFNGFVGVMFVMALTGYYLGAEELEATFLAGMFGQLLLVLVGAWLGRRVVGETN